MADTTILLAPGVPVRADDNGDGTYSLATSTVVASDLAIGAVEIKNATDDTRATVGANGLHTEVRAIAAGETHLGEVGGRTLLPVSVPVMSVAGAYATGDYIGTTTTPQAFVNAVRVSGGKGVIKSIVIADNLTTAAVALELWLFSATFTAPTDNAAWAITDAHQLLCVGVIPISTARWYANANGKVYSDDTLALPFNCAATSLFYALVARGTTPAWTSLDLQITLGILAD